MLPIFRAYGVGGLGEGSWEERGGGAWEDRRLPERLGCASVRALGRCLWPTRTVEFSQSRARPPLFAHTCMCANVFAVLAGAAPCLHRVLHRRGQHHQARVGGGGHGGGVVTVRLLTRRRRMGERRPLYDVIS
jgi:hypothetical protein